MRGCNNFAFDILHHHTTTFHCNLDFFNIAGKQGQRCEGCRTNGEALTRRSSGVAQGVEGVCTMAYFLAEFAHLGITTGIVGNRSVGVSGKGDAQRREHTHCSNTYAIEAVGKTCRRH